MNDLLKAFGSDPYQGYAYSYPHKTVYREFTPAIPLPEVWANENKSSLFLYVHIPFCEMRCGFCNLFTMANPEQDMISNYLHALESQARIVAESVGSANFAQLAIGGGTPSFLNEQELERLFNIIEQTMGADPTNIPTSFEVSPKTVTKSKLQMLQENGVDRISIGIQSFLEHESKLLGRPQKNSEVISALENIKDQKFGTLNIDLIYGGAEQTSSTWNDTLVRTMEYSPEEVYLYPLYVRPLTGLDKMGLSWDNFRLQLYRQGRDFLLSNGYEQMSMRMFRKKNLVKEKNNITYCCQEDGMIGLGSGARSYTSAIHYSSEYAVGRKGVKNIIRSFNEEAEIDFAKVRYGVVLSEAEQKRRYVIKSLLHGDGLDLSRYKDRFQTGAVEEFGELPRLMEAGLVYRATDSVLKLTQSGMEFSDSIGPFLYSAPMKDLMNQYELR